ncbi:YgdI/YgdR family lipoprotein [Salmonella enterica]|nr:YgdI/YgdR family lipoprotein [Salmonella enterica]
MLAGCTTTYTMTTRTGEIIETQGKPEVDTATGMTKYADAYGYHRVIKTSEIVQTTEGASKLDNALKQLEAVSSMGTGLFLGLN